jgi:hypothetical protein
LILRHRPRDSVDLLLGGAVLTIAYLILGHIAFMNYYSVAAVLLMAVIAIDGNHRFVAGDDIALPRGRHSHPVGVVRSSEPVTVGSSLD